MSAILRTVLALVSALLVASSSGAQVAQTKHNLSVSGPGTAKAASETRICLFCHTPHNASPDSPLWNRQLPGSTYVPFLNVTIDLAHPKRAGNPKTTNGSGFVVWHLPIPQAGSGHDVWFQAVQTENKTNVVSTRIE